MEMGMERELHLPDDVLGQRARHVLRPVPQRLDGGARDARERRQGRRGPCRGLAVVCRVGRGSCMSTWPCRHGTMSAAARPSRTPP